MTIDVSAFVKLLPNLKQDVQRLKFLQEEAKEARVVVFGKFNHGKSTLLNAIVGEEAFKASDARETKKNQNFTDTRRNIIWVDTPGLDADIKGKDDEKAREGVFTTADVILLVHNLKTGELDHAEAQYYEELLKKPNAQQRVILVLTQMDQVEPDQLAQASALIQKQFPQLTTLAVSAVRYSKGKALNQPKFIERSGINELMTAIEGMTSAAIAHRAKETSTLKQSIKNALTQKQATLQAKVDQAQTDMDNMTTQLKRDVQNYVATVQSKL